MKSGVVVVDLLIMVICCNKYVKVVGKKTFVIPNIGILEIPFTEITLLLGLINHLEFTVEGFKINVKV